MFVGSGVTRDWERAMVGPCWGGGKSGFESLWTERGKRRKAVEVSWMDEREKEMGRRVREGRKRVEKKRGCG
jgi:hypothetical protein